MIVTGIFLLFAMVPMACIAEEQSRESNQCTTVTPTSFPSCLSTQNSAIFLGALCSFMQYNPDISGHWIGYAGKGIDKCQICCAHKDEHGNITYTSTTSPNGFPCGGGKVCNAGKCQNK
uniref:Putative ixostatin n=1 Tax=Ixodes ricinus TaxID=34613 RepID=A0A0K8RLK8_IXORI